MKTRSTWVVLVVLFGPGTGLAQQANEPARAKAAFDALFAASLAKVHASGSFDEALALADKMLQAADDDDPPPPLLAMLCENAYTLAAANTRGVETAVRAMNSLSARQPERQLACLGKIADVQRALYAEKTGLGKHAAGERLIETQSARADQAAAEDDYAAAVKADEDALAIAKAISSSRKDALLYTLKLFQTRQKSQAALEALKARLKANPADSPARADIIRLYIVEFDNPARAAAWLSEESNQLYRTYIPAAQEDPGSLPETLCLELGDWYSQHAEKASLDSRPPLLRRAMEYYEAFLAKHPAADSKRVKAKLTLDNLRPQLARSSLVPKPRGVRSRPSEPTGPAIGAGALVRRPVLIRGAGAWTIEPKLPRASLTVAALSPGGKCLALADASGGLRIYDALTGALTALLPGHSQPVTHLAWSQAGDTLASGDAEGKVCLWSIPSRRNLGVCGGHDGGVRALAWSADGTRLAAAGKKTVDLLSARTGKLVAALPSSDNMSDLGDLADLAWTGPDQLAAADDGRCVLVWQLGPKPAKPTLFPAQARLDVRALAFGPGSGAPLAVALGNGACCLWDARSGEATPPFAPAGSEPVTALAWSPDAKSILTGQARRKGQPTIRCWSLAGKKELFAVGADEPSVRHVAWAGDGKTALVTRAAALAVINAAAGATWRTFPANDLALRGKPALAGDGQTIAWPCSDNTIHFWNPHSGQVRPVVQAQGTLRGVQWHPDGKRLLVNAGTLVVVNTVSGRTLRTLEGKDYQAAALSRDGQRVFAARAGAARTDKSNSADIFVLDARTGRALAVLTAGLGSVEHLQISPDGALLAGAAGAAIHVWDLSALNAAGDPGEKVERIAGRPKAEISGDGRVTDLAFAPQGQTLAALRAGGAIDLWTPEGQRALGGVRPTRPESFVWSADGKRLTLFRRGAGAVVIDADTGALIREYAHQPEHYFVFGREKIVHCFSNRMEIYAAASNWELSATFLPLPGGQSLAVSADGYFTGTEGVENDIVFVAGTPGGFSCQSPADFAKTFNRPNNPAFVTP